MPQLSVIIPSRNEMFLARTIEDILENIEGNTEIIAVLDGNWADPPIKDHPKVTLIYHSQSIGQRAACNEAAKLSRAKYLLKCDAHCSFDKGFDVKLMADMQDDWTMVPTMRNIHAFDWVCKKCGDRRYQGPTPINCPKCDNITDFERDVVWIAKTNPQSVSYCFDSGPHFQYFREFRKRSGAKGDITETMSLQGSCFMVTRDKFFELGLCNEKFGSWGSQGIEVAVKTWLSGGRVVCNQKTWYGHMFRTQGGDFGFPWPCSGRQVDNAKKYAKDLFFNNKWEKQIRPLSWLLDKFWPVPGWSDAERAKITEAGITFFNSKNNDIPTVNAPFVDSHELSDSSDTPVREQEMPSDAISLPIVNSEIPIPKSVKALSPLSRGIVYYTDCQLAPEILEPCQKQLLRCCNGVPIVSVSLKPMDFGENYVLPLERSVLTMFKQILEGIKRSTADILYFAEHDCLYIKEHFKFTPPRKDVFYYNENQWQVDTTSGRALFYHCMRLSTLCAYRELLLEHYTKRVERVEKEGFTLKMGYEPGGHRYPRGVDNYTRERFMTPYPLIDLRHSGTVSPNRWRQKDFRNKGPLWAWTEADEIPYWGPVKGCIKELLEGLR